jgi:DNA-directed RNA polymerase specialized sigma24 family protein
MKPGNHEEHIRHSFDSYCKSVLKRTARELYGAIKRRGEREVTFSAMSARELASLSVTDEYFKDAYIFSVLGESGSVTNKDPAEAVNTLPSDRRDIVLMSYFFDMTDREIAEKLNMARRTVAHKRTSTLQELKKIIESEE